MLADALAQLPFQPGYRVGRKCWCAIEIICLAAELTASIQILVLHGHNARHWEPKRLRLRLFSAALFEHLTLSHMSEAPYRRIRMSKLAYLTNGPLSRLSNVVKRFG